MVSDHRKLLDLMDAMPSLLAVYNKQANHFYYHRDLLNYIGTSMEGCCLWDYLRDEKIISNEDAEKLKDIIFSLNEKNSVFFKVFSFGVRGRHILSFTFSGNDVIILFKLFDQGDLDTKQIKYDEITRLLSRKSFCSEIEEIIAKNPQKTYSLIAFDIIKFKAINDIFGFDKGDKLLIYIADVLREGHLPIVCACRVSADRFAFLADVSEDDSETIALNLFSKIKQQYDINFELGFNAGVYLTLNDGESGNSMLDKATLAKSAIKGNYTKQINFYTEKLRDEMLSEQEVITEMVNALKDEQFVVFYQPQYNHSTGMLVGAEALVRWNHPKKGMIPPIRFIPIFEKNSFITKLDFYVFEKAAKFIRRSMDEGFSIVPISVNFSKHDIFLSDFVNNLENIRKKYDIPPKYLRIELTESILVGNNKIVTEVLSDLHSLGYIIEMDDFGSGYSSLNVLKDLDFDIIKLDMLFLEGGGKNNKGGTILTSVINMAKWLNISVIAEGVETVEQADFLKSVGCNYIQGYLYSKPIPEEEYEKIVKSSSIGVLIPQINMIDTFNSANFWDPKSQETLIFNNFVGAAVIFNYDRKSKKLEILRINKKYLQELGMNICERDIIRADPSATLNEVNKKIYFDTLEKAIETGEEQECETWREIHSDCCGDEHFCIRSTLTVIARSDDRILFYGLVRNITSEKKIMGSLIDSDRNFRIVAEHANVYFWEYSITTKEMRPCFRCMRDLGLPPLIKNYPEGAFERGVFPPESFEPYREMMKKVDSGIGEIEADINLTLDRIPFHVKYTTEFDENGHPVKAFGSATLIK